MIPATDGTDRSASRNSSAFGTFMFCARRAYAVRLAADCHVFDRFNRFFCRIQNFDVSNSAFFQFLPHDTGKRTNTCPGNIVNMKLSRVNLLPAPMQLITGT